MEKSEKLARLMNRLFAVSLALLGVSSLILSVTSLAGIALPVWAVRTLGIVNLVSLPCLVWSSVKRMLAGRETLPQPPQSTEGAEAGAPKA